MSEHKSTLCIFCKEIPKNKAIYCATCTFNFSNDDFKKRVVEVLDRKESLHSCMCSSEIKKELELE